MRERLGNGLDDHVAGGLCWRGPRRCGYSRGNEPTAVRIDVSDVEASIPRRSWGRWTGSASSPPLPDFLPVTRTGSCRRQDSGEGTGLGFGRIRPLRQLTPANALASQNTTKLLVFACHLVTRPDRRLRVRRAFARRQIETQKPILTLCHNDFVEMGRSQGTCSITSQASRSKAMPGRADKAWRSVSVPEPRAASDPTPSRLASNSMNSSSESEGCRLSFDLMFWRISKAFFLYLLLHRTKDFDTVGTVRTQDRGAS